MKLQILSDLHLETEAFTPEPAPGAELLVLAGDIDSTWAGLSLFKDWPVPVLYVPGNHEFDQRDIHEALATLRQRCTELGLHMLERESCVIQGRDGRRIRFVGTVRWSDFDLFGEAQRAKSQRAAGYFVKVMRATRHGQPFDPEAVREEALACRAWLADTLALRPTSDAHWDATVAITHFGPSLRSADPRYGRQPGTASFCNADDALLPLADLWVHGHLHCRHDYTVAHDHGITRVISNARGHGYKGESTGYDGLLTVDV
ncbi:MAG: metallophosphoesterase [Aquabacterium sp.]|uniref:metallophosphoesterase n=1 Tax=Aquabacterium sp. TaxID=1872578 RepID=UPI003BB17354